MCVISQRSRGYFTRWLLGISRKFQRSSFQLKGILNIAAGNLGLGDLVFCGPAEPRCHLIAAVAVIELRQGGQPTRMGPTCSVEPSGLRDISKLTKEVFMERNQESSVPKFDSTPVLSHYGEFQHRVAQAFLPISSPLLNLP